MDKKKSKIRHKIIFKVPISKILKQWLEKGDISEEEISKKIKAIQLTVINGSSVKSKRKVPPKV